jgi:hypothetical protein
VTIVFDGDLQSNHSFYVMSRDQLNSKIANLVSQVSQLKTMLEEPAEEWDVRAVAAQCKQTAVGIREYGDQVQNFNASSSWKIPADKFDEVISNAREFITYAQNCCRSKSADINQINNHASGN